MVVGIPGSGKSFFSRQFSDTFGAPLVSYDEIRSSLYGTAAFDKSQLEIVKAVMDIQIAQLLKTNKTFIVDGIGMTRIERSNLRKHILKHSYDMLIVWVQTDVATAQFRSMKRSQRRKDDEYNVSLNHDQYTVLEKRFTAPSESEKTVVISGKHTYASQAKIVLKNLVTPRDPLSVEKTDFSQARNASSSSRGILIR
jgi:predicted kinase